MKKKDIIEKRIIELWKEVDPLIPVDSYVIDFAYTEERVWMVELNDFGTTASSSLFNWKTEWQVMHEGPFELRILKEPIKEVRSMIAKPLRELAGWENDINTKQVTNTNNDQEEKGCIIS